MLSLHPGRGELFFRASDIVWIPERPFLKVVVETAVPEYGVCVCYERISQPSFFQLSSAFDVAIEAFLFEEFLPR